MSAHLLCAVVETMALRQAEEAQKRQCFELINKMIDASYEYLERHSNFLHLALQWDVDRKGNAGMLTMDGVQTFLDDSESMHPTDISIPDTGSGGAAFKVPVPEPSDLMIDFFTASRTRMRKEKRAEAHVQTMFKAAEEGDDEGDGEGWGGGGNRGCAGCVTRGRTRTHRMMMGKHFLAATIALIMLDASLGLTAILISSFEGLTLYCTDVAVTGGKCNATALGDPFGQIVNAVTEGGSLMQLFEYDASEWLFTNITNTTTSGGNTNTTSGNTTSGNGNLASAAVAVTVVVGRDHFERYDPLLHGMSRPVEKQASVYMQPVSLAVLSLFMVEILLQLFVSGFLFFKHIGFVVDLIVIVTSFCLELLTDTGAFLTIVRMWRVLRLFNILKLKVRQDIDDLEEQRTLHQLQCREAKRNIVKERTGASEAAEKLQYLQVAGRVHRLKLKGQKSARVKRSMSFRVGRKEGDAGVDPFACLKGTPTAAGGDAVGTGGIGYGDAEKVESADKAEVTKMAMKHEEEGEKGGGGEEKGEAAAIVRIRDETEAKAEAKAEAEAEVKAEVKAEPVMVVTEWSPVLKGGTGGGEGGGGEGVSELNV